MRIGIAVKGVCKCKYNVGKKTVVVKKKIGTPKSKQKDEWNEEFVKKKKKKKKKEVWKKKVAIRLGVQIMKIEMSLGEVYVSWKRILWKSDYDEMFSFISRYLNSFIPFFQITKHLNPWPHYKL